jgi:hypothetical protein
VLLQQFGDDLVLVGQLIFEVRDFTLLGLLKPALAGGPVKRPLRLRQDLV